MSSVMPLKVKAIFAEEATAECLVIYNLVLQN